MNKSDLKCVIMLAWTVETSDCRNAVAFFLACPPSCYVRAAGHSDVPYCPPLKSGQQEHGQGRRVRDVAKIM